MALVDWSPEQVEAFLSMQFEAQTRSWDEQFPHALFHVVEHDGRAIGRLYLDHRDDEIRVVDIALLPSHRGRGIGGALLAQVLAEAGAAGKAVRIHVEKNNPAMRLYHRLGFVTIADVGVYDLMEWNPPDESKGRPAE
jgi:ribosomal protein S18 acetylase RimI-like enzyme